MNETIESLQNRIASAQKEAQRGPEIEAKITAVQAELSYLDSLIQKAGELAGAMEPMARQSRGIMSPRSHDAAQALSSLHSCLSQSRDHYRTELRQTQAAHKQVRAHQASIQLFQEAIEARREQEKRLAGGLLGAVGMGKPFGDAKPVITRDLSFILARTRFESGRPAGVVERQNHEALAHVRATQAQEDLARWAKENEVQEAGTRPVHYYAHDGSRASACVLYRVIHAREGMRDHVRIDPHARTLLIPFDPHQAKQWCREIDVQVSGSALLRDWHVEISQDGRDCEMRPVIATSGEVGWE